MIQGEINNEKKWKRDWAECIYSVRVGGDMATSADHVANLDFVGCN